MKVGGNLLKFIKKSKPEYITLKLTPDESFIYFKTNNTMQQSMNF